MTTWAEDAAAALEALGADPTPVEARAVTDRYPNVDVLAGLASLALEAGGGGGATVIRPAILRHTAASGTGGGTPVAASWGTRVLNDESDPDAIVTLASNQFTLAAGDYLLEATANFWGVNKAKLRIRDITNGATVIHGLNNYVGVDSSLGLVGRITVAAPTVYELQHYTEQSTGDFNLGQPVSQGTEVYAVLTITKEDA